MKTGVYFTVDQDVRDDFKKIATMSGTTQNSLINQLMRKFVKKHQDIVQKYNDSVKSINFEE